MNQRDIKLTQLTKNQICNLVKGQKTPTSNLRNLNAQSF